MCACRAHPPRKMSSRQPQPLMPGSSLLSPARPTEVGLACETSSRLCARNASCACPYCNLASTPGHSQTLSHSCGENLGEGLVPILCHEPEMVDSFPNTVKPPNKRHIGDGPFVPCGEVVLFSDVSFLTYWKS